MKGKRTDWKDIKTIKIAEGNEIRVYRRLNSYIISKVGQLYCINLLRQLSSFI